MKVKLVNKGTMEWTRKNVGIFDAIMVLKQYFLKLQIIKKVFFRRLVEEKEMNKRKQYIEGMAGATRITFWNSASLKARLNELNETGGGCSLEESSAIRRRSVFNNKRLNPGNKDILFPLGTKRTLHRLRGTGTFDVV